MFEHTTVLLKETVDGLNVKEDGTYVDCTLGGAGHSEYLLSQLSEKANWSLLTRMKPHSAMRRKNWRIMKDKSFS